MSIPFIARLQLGLRTFAADVAQGFFAISHNGLAVVGLSIFFFVVALTVRPDLRVVTEAKVISKKYRVAPEPLSALVSEAYDVGPANQIEPTLILAVMAVESGFNPFAQSHVGAQGLMQVMTKVHEQKYQGFGGALAAFDPVANVRVGVNVLKECINRAGSIEGGLKLYVGAGNMKDDQGYASKVMAENARLQQVAKGLKVPITPPPSTAAEAATARLESLWEKAQRLTPFGKDDGE
jgi:hypothetical protein